LLKVRPAIEPRLAAQGLTWEDVRPAIESIKEADELRELVADSQPLLDRLKQGPSVKAQNAATGTTKLVIRPDIMPPSQRRLYNVFFDKKSPSNLVKVFSTLALELLGMIKNGTILVSRMIHLVSKCMPPSFSIIPEISLEIARKVMSLCYAMLCYAMLCYAMLCNAMLCYAMLCYAMLCYAMLCYAMRKVMALSFKLRNVPFILVRTLRRIIQFPNDTSEQRDSSPQSPGPARPACRPGD
jgi:hypothetical protein